MKKTHMLIVAAVITATIAVKAACSDPNGCGEANTCLNFQIAPVYCPADGSITCACEYLTSYCVCGKAQ